MGAAFVCAATVLISFHVWRNLSPAAWPDPTCRHRTWLSRSRASLTANAQERRHRPHPAARQQGRRRARSTRPDKTWAPNARCWIHRRTPRRSMLDGESDALI